MGLDADTINIQIPAIILVTGSSGRNDREQISNGY